MDPISNLKETILKKYDRLSLDDTFQFRCHKDVPCFNLCCRDVNIFLTPYDILRLKKRLGISSDLFLSKYTIMPMDAKLNYPVVQLKMDDSEERKCYFVTEEGCSVYSDRPWPCRMYPVGEASPSESVGEEQFYFMMKEDVCKGFGEKPTWTIREWLKDQGIDKYAEFGGLFKEVALHNYFTSGRKLDTRRMQMFFLACYNIDEFRVFLYESTFFNRFEVDEQTKTLMETDDEALLRFGFKWLKFALFSEPVMKIIADSPDDYSDLDSEASKTP
ncbi:YkgJ family cysteine cluster protein [candidate division KSB1 bacterium]